MWQPIPLSQRIHSCIIRSHPQPLASPPEEAVAVRLEEHVYALLRIRKGGRVKAVQREPTTAMPTKTRSVELSYLVRMTADRCRRNESSIVCFRAGQDRTIPRSLYRRVVHRMTSLVVLPGLLYGCFMKVPRPFDHRLQTCPTGNSL